jgi:hypothetical protein
MAKNNRYEKKTRTLDQRHLEKIKQFENNNHSLPAKYSKLQKLEKELENLRSKSGSLYRDNVLRKMTNLAEEIDTLKYNIQKIEMCDDSLDYASNAVHIIVELLNNPQIGSEERLYDTSVDVGERNIFSYLASNNENINTPPTESYRSMVQISEKYESAITPYIIDTKVSENMDCKNPDCDGEKISSYRDGHMTCCKCGLTEKIPFVIEKSGSKEDSHETGTYAYKRINHFLEIVSQVQARASTIIPDEILTDIKREMDKRNLTKSDLDSDRLRRFLKKLNHSKYYEHIPHILQMITGTKPIKFKRGDEDKIKKMFCDIQDPFALYCPPTRKNFLNYYYVLHKFCELLNLHSFKSSFPLLKNTKKLAEHDKIWKKICAHLRWEYKKSI